MSLIDHDATDRLADTAFKHAAIGQALVRLDGRFIRVNDAFASLVGLKSDEVLDCSFQSLTHLGGRSFLDMLEGSKKAFFEPLNPSKYGVFARSSAFSRSRS